MNLDAYTFAALRDQGNICLDSPDFVKPASDRWTDHDQDGEFLARLLDILLPEGGHVMPFAEAYFDESEDAGRLLCVGGYLFEKGGCIALSAAWRKILKAHGLAYFRMVECAHGNRQFAGRTNEERVEIQTKLINLIKRYASYGYSVTFELQYANRLPSAKSVGLDLVSPYALCCYFCLMGVQHWAETNNFKGQIAYFFESGHASYGEAGKIMNSIFSEPALQEYYRYGSHAFADKKQVIPLQCADVLAWQWRKYRKDLALGRSKPRADLTSLLERPQCSTHHFDGKTVESFLAVVAGVNERLRKSS